jgi:hypothetical protein
MMTQVFWMLLMSCLGAALGAFLRLHYVLGVTIPSENLILLGLLLPLALWVRIIQGLEVNKLKAMNKRLEGKIKELTEAKNESAQEAGATDQLGGQG